MPNSPEPGVVPHPLRSGPSSNQASAPTSEATLPFAGVELGGTKCVATLAYGPGALIEQHTVPTTQPRETLTAIRAILESWIERTGIEALGIASFGPVALNRTSSDYGHILATNKPGWVGADVLGFLSGGLELPTGFDTDVNGAALAERRWGSGRGLDDFAYVTVGTGIGVGLLVHGRPTRGIGHSEIGHIRVPRLQNDFVPSVCRYHDDCVEGLASGSVLLARLGDRSLDQVAPDDRLWDPIVAALASMAHALVCSSGPIRIALGGGVPTAQPHLLDRVNAALLDSLNGYMDLPPGPYIVPPELGELAGPLGSIALAADACATRAQRLAGAQQEIVSP